MAGQPQEPSWQPAAQDQAREAWPPAPSFTPQPGVSQDTFAFPPSPPGFGQEAQPGPAYQPPPPPPGFGQEAPPGPAYPPPSYEPPTYQPPPYDPGGQDRGQDQAQGRAQDQAQGRAQDQPQGWAQDRPQGWAQDRPQDLGPGPAQNQGMPQWQASPGMPPAAAPRPRPRGEKGFLSSLFDFSFQSMVTPKIIKVLYMLLTGFIGLWALIFTIFCFKHAGAIAGFFVLIVLDPIYILLTLGVYRIVFEFVMVTFRLHEDVKAIRARAEAQD